MTRKKISSEPVNDYDKYMEKVNNMPRIERVKRVYEDMVGLLEIPKRFKNKTFSNYKPYSDNQEGYKEVIDYTKTFADRYKAGDWLILSGGYGLGKTHLALACARQCLKYFAEKYVDEHAGVINYSQGGTKVIFRTSSDLIQEIRDSYDSDKINEQDVMNRFRMIPLLIIDDLGTEKASEWQHEKMYTILDYRYREMKTTIITTNLTMRELKVQVSERIVDRMIEAAGKGKYLRKFEGESYRKKECDR